MTFNSAVAELAYWKQRFRRMNDLFRQSDVSAAATALFSQFFFVIFFLLFVVFFHPPPELDWENALNSVVSFLLPLLFLGNNFLLNANEMRSAKRASGRLPS